MLFKDLELDSKLLRAVEACGFEVPTQIQQQAIPRVLSGVDLMASSQTGTGKTAAFVLPILQRLLTPATKKGKGPRVLVLTPTRELAVQVNDDIRKYGRFARFTTGNVLGGMSYGPQIKLLQNPVDLLVATPGRLMDHMNMKRVDFSRLEVFVLDEADRMLDMGFIGDVRKIASGMPKDRQTLLFSATLEGKILEVAKALLQNPEKIQLAANKKRHESILQRIFQADTMSHKKELLSRQLEDDGVRQAVIFTATKRSADQLARALEMEGHNTAALHGDMTQGARRRTVESVRSGKVRLLVATDVAARGLDISGLTHVINFDLPMSAEDYIHRIGRTGRAGANGVAISLVGPQDWGKLAGIERLTGQKLEREIIPGLEPKTPEPRSGLGGTTGRSWKPGTRKRGGFARRRRFARP